MKSSIPAPGMWRVLESSLLVLHSRQRGKGLKGGCLSLRVGRNNRNSNPNFGAGNCSPTAESTAESWEIRGQSGSNDSCSESENSPFRPLSTPAERVRIPPFPPEQVLLTRSVGLSGAQSPAPRGAFCYGLLTDPIAIHTQYPSQTPFCLRTSLLFCRGTVGGGVRKLWVLPPY